MSKIVHLGNDVVSTPITDSLVSSATNSALSANQGRVLKGYIDTLETKTDEIDNKADLDIISSAYNPNETYSKDGGTHPIYCIDENELYKCTVATATGLKPSTHSAQFERVNVGDEIGALKVALSNSIKFVKQNITFPNDMSSKSVGSDVIFTTSVPNNCVAIAVVIDVFGQKRIMNNCFDQIATYSNVTGVTSKIPFSNAYNSATGFILYMQY